VCKIDWKGGSGSEINNFVFATLLLTVYQLFQGGFCELSQQAGNGTFCVEDCGGEDLLRAPFLVGKHVHFFPALLKNLSGRSEHPSASAPNDFRKNVQQPI